jgi:F0F1-type ATP synthase membrane subunit b/b'
MSPAHSQPKRRKRVAILVAGLVTAGGVAWAASAFAATGNTTAAAQSIVCPTPQIGAVPAAAQAEVSRELANLDKQITEANTRLRNTVGQGGANFVQNAILGPLASKRTAALERIAIAIGRVGTRPQGLEQFATCSVADTTGGGTQAPPATTSTTTVVTQPPATTAPAGVGQIVCPTPQIGAVPAAAQAEVNRELANLDKQITEANTRLQNTVGQGGANFVQNAILGPLASKRGAALDRIAIAIGRVAAKPQGLQQFATCTLVR